MTAKNKFWVFVLVGYFLVVVAVMTSVLVLKSKKVDLKLINSKSGSLIYKSPRFKYQFFYPSNLVLSPNQSGNYLEQVNFLVDNQSGPWAISVFVSKSRFKNISDWFNDEKLLILARLGKKYSLVIDQRLQISKLDAVVTYVSGPEADPNQKTLSWLKDNVLYQFNYRFINEAEFLSSFQVED